MSIDRISHQATDLGGPLHSDAARLGVPGTRSAPPSVTLPRPESAVGSVDITRGWLVPGQGTAPEAPVERSVTVPFGDSQLVFSGDASQIGTAEATVALGRRGGISINAVAGASASANVGTDAGINAGTNAGTATVLGGNVQVSLFGDALSLGADYRASEPNDGTATGSRDLAFSAQGQIGTVKLDAGVSVASPKVAADATTTYSLGAQVPVANEGTLKVSGGYTRASSADKDRYTGTAGVQWPNKGIELRVEGSAAETQVQVRARLNF